MCGQETHDVEMCRENEGEEDRRGGGWIKKKTNERRNRISKHPRKADLISIRFNIIVAVLT